MVVRRKKAVAKKTAPVKKAAPAKKAAPKKRVPVKKVAVKQAAKPVTKKPVKKVGSAAKKTVAKKSAPSSTAAEGTWDKETSPGANVDRLKTSGLTWKAIGFLWNEAGIEPEVVPGADGGKLLRARTGFLKGTEGQPSKRRAKGSGSRKAKDPDDDRSYAEQAEERLEAAIARRKVPWEGDPAEYSDEELLTFLDGKGIEFVSKVSGNTAEARLIKGSKHTVIKHGKDGPYVTFASMDGPFLNISLSRIINVS